MKDLENIQSGLHFYSIFENNSFYSDGSCGCYNYLLNSHLEIMYEKFGVKRIEMFRSFARGEEREDSDLDMLVEFEEEQKTFDNHMDLKFFLEDLFGREVDLVTEKAIKPQLKDIIMKDIVYA